MYEKHITIDIFQVGFFVFLIVLGILKQVDWMLVVLFVLSSTHIKFKFPIR